MSRPMTPEEHAGLDATMAAVNARLTLRQRVDARMHRPVFRLNARHVVAVVVSTGLWIGAIYVAAWLNRVM